MSCPNCKNKTQRITELEINQRNYIHWIRAMVGAAGIPDKDDALRAVVDWGKQALNDKINKDE